MHNTPITIYQNVSDLFWEHCGGDTFSTYIANIDTRRVHNVVQYVGEVDK